VSTLVESMWGIWWVGTSFEDCPWDGAEQVSFDDPIEAERFLGQFVNDCFEMEKVRRLLLGRSFDLPGLTDRDAIERLAWDLEAGRLRVYRPARPVMQSPLSFTEKHQAEPARSSPVAQEKRTDFTIELLSEEGFPIPEARYVLVFAANGEERVGALDVEGKASLKGVPVGPVIVSYVDPDDVQGKALAVSVRRAFDRQDCGPAYLLLQQSGKVVQRAVAAYDRYFNDYTGKGFVADLEEVFTDPDARLVVGTLLAKAGVAGWERPEIFDWRRQDQG
jgi:hypothetical protein